ncbi:MAG: peptide chain release factor aRF-1 [Thaumarchaeota archaeon]|nr:peptide chain release factor aRF-1 [Nitrososphaerota archaeon]
MSSKLDSVALYRTKKILRELSDKKGRGTELVTIFIPPKKALHEVINNLREEYGTASNIKSDTTRNHVQDALVKSQQRLKLYNRTPENGIVLFVGALPTNGPGSEQIFVYEVMPPKPVQTYLYRCDDHFHLEHLRDMLREENVIGILSIDTTEAGLGIVTGEKVEIVDVLTSGVPGKSSKGGQSARRYERLREMELTDYFNRVSAHSTRVFIDSNSVKGMIVAGPGQTKDDFLKGEFLDYRLQKNVIAVIDGAYSGAEGVREAFEKAADAMSNLRVVEERKLVQKFLREVNSDNPLAVYGINEVIKTVQQSKAHTILASEDLDLTEIKVTCKKCGEEKSRIVKRENYVAEKQRLITEPSKCGSTDYEVVERDIVDILDELALETGAKLEVISGKTEEGQMLKSFNGITALLRYR